MCKLRLSKVIYPDNALFRSWIDNLRDGNPISAFSDMTLSPVELGDVVALLSFIGSRAEPGLYQASGARDISYHDFALMLASQMGIDGSMVRATSARQSGIPSKQILAYTSLDCSRLTELTGFVQPEPAQVIRQVLLQS